MAFNWRSTKRGGDFFGTVAEEELHLAVGWSQATLGSPGWDRANAHLQLQGCQGRVRLVYRLYTCIYIYIHVYIYIAHIHIVIVTYIVDTERERGREYVYVYIYI